MMKSNRQNTTSLSTRKAAQTACNTTFNAVTFVGNSVTNILANTLGFLVILVVVTLRGIIATAKAIARGIAYGIVATAKAIIRWHLVLLCAASALSVLGYMILAKLAVDSLGIQTLVMISLAVAAVVGVVATVAHDQKAKAEAEARRKAEAHRRAQARKMDKSHPNHRPTTSNGNIYQFPQKRKGA